MPLPKERIYTIDDIYALPERERAELRRSTNDCAIRSGTDCWYLR